MTKRCALFLIEKKSSVIITIIALLYSASLEPVRGKDSKVCCKLHCNRKQYHRLKYLHQKDECSAISSAASERWVHTVFKRCLKSDWLLSLCLLVLFLAPSYTLQLVLCSGSADASSLSFYNPGRHARFAACLGWGSSASSLFQCACSCLSPLSWIDPDCFVA